MFVNSFLSIRKEKRKEKVFNHDSDEEDDDNNDKALINTGGQPAFRKQFKGKCCNCGNVQ